MTIIFISTCCLLLNFIFPVIGQTNEVIYVFNFSIAINKAGGDGTRGWKYKLWEYYPTLTWDSMIYQYANCSTQVNVTKSLDMGACWKMISNPPQTSRSATRKSSGAIMKSIPIANYSSVTISIGQIGEACESKYKISSHHYYTTMFTGHNNIDNTYNIPEERTAETAIDIGLSSGNDKQLTPYECYYYDLKITGVYSIYSPITTTNKNDNYDENDNDKNDSFVDIFIGVASVIGVVIAVIFVYRFYRTRIQNSMMINTTAQIVDEKPKTETVVVPNQTQTVAVVNSTTNKPVEVQSEKLPPSYDEIEVEQELPPAYDEIDVDIKNTNDEMNDKQINHEVIEVKQWFDSQVHLDEYYQVFVNNGYDRLILIKQITENELIQMGITKLAHKNHILSEIDKLELY